MASIFYKDTNGKLVQIPLGEGGTEGTAKTTVLTSVDRGAVLPAGTAFTVPKYEVGSGNLSVYMDGLLCVLGETYTERTSTSIVFADDIPTGTEITAMAIEGNSAEGKLYTRLTTSTQRDAVLVAGTPFDVPDHLVGFGRCRVFLDGLLLQHGVGWTEANASQIVFTFDLPTDAHVYVQTQVFV